MKVKLTLTNEMLGSLPANKEIFTDYIALNNPTYDLIESEIEAVPEYEHGITVFPRNKEGKPFVYDYQIRGFLKGAFSALNKAGKDGYAGGKACKDIKAFKKVVDQQIFVEPREIAFQGLDENWTDDIQYCERPLRASTPMGERIALAKSEVIPAGVSLEFEIIALSDKLKPAIIEALEYGRFSGLGQWRNAGKGLFQYEIVED